VDAARALGWEPGKHVRIGGLRDADRGTGGKSHRPKKSRRPVESRFVCTKCGREFIGLDEWCPACKEEDRQRRRTLMERLL